MYQAQVVILEISDLSQQVLITLLVQDKKAFLINFNQSLGQVIITMIHISQNQKESRQDKKLIKHMPFTLQSLVQVSIKIYPKDQCREQKQVKLKEHQFKKHSHPDQELTILSTILKKVLLKLEQVQELKWIKATHRDLEPMN